MVRPHWYTKDPTLLNEPTTLLMKLQDPQEYMPELERLRERDKYSKGWKLRVQKHTNRHRETDGGLWGWYEVHPLGIVVGYWGTGQDDLRGVDLSEWNQRAEAISMANSQD